MWYVWRLKYRWENLCPILFADPLGFFVVMKRAAQPVTREGKDAADPDYHPNITAEAKPEDWGRLGELIVAVDYGLPDQDMVDEQRAYYTNTEPSTVGGTNASRSPTLSCLRWRARSLWRQ
jgi:hypothetical protein